MMILLKSVIEPLSMFLLAGVALIAVIFILRAIGWLVSNLIFPYDVEVEDEIGYVFLGVISLVFIYGCYWTVWGLVWVGRLICEEVSKYLS